MQFDGLNVLVTAGGTREPIDEVRYIGNRSSGRMGWALAEAAYDRGARVDLIAANVSLTPPAGVNLVQVGTADELNAAVQACEQQADVIFMAAAVADFKPAKPTLGKIKKAGKTCMALDLAPTVDILAGIAGRRRPGICLVGFAAEYGPDFADEAARKLADKGIDIIVANDIADPSIGFDSEENEVTIFGHDGVIAKPGRGSKREIAEAILDALGASLGDSRHSESGGRL